MNKLVIIGNGFDLAHGLKTSYKDFIIWYLNKVNSSKACTSSNNFIYFESKNGQSNGLTNNPEKKILDIDGFNEYKKLYGLITRYKHDDFVKSILVKIELLKWVDIEKEYYDFLVKIYKSYEQYGSFDAKELVNLNKALYLIGEELKDYLGNHLKPPFVENESIKSLFDSEILNNPDEDVYVLNFNYTSFVESYLPALTKLDKESTIKSEIVGLKYPDNEMYNNINVYLNQIHGELGSDNHLVFGYGDETDKYYEKIEDLKDNEFLKYMKSFAYLQSSNYKHLFEFLDQEDLPVEKRKKFNVYIMGHSCGVSDRLLFTHIFEHPLMNSVQLYYYQYGEKESENDFFQKTQELSRHFRKDAKHKMRKCIVPFNESKPLTKFKPQN